MATSEVMSAPETATRLEIVANRPQLLAELSAAVGVIERKTTIPILANLLLEAKDGVLHISSSNLSQTIRTSLPVKVRSEGSLTVPARKLYEYVKLLGKDEVTIEQQENNWIQLRCGRSKTKMVGMDRKNYPLLPSPEGDAVSLDATILRDFIQKVLLSVSHEESRYTLNAALLIIAPAKASMVSTDGHRLTLISKTTENRDVLGAELRLLIPTAALNELKSLLAANSDIETVDVWESPMTLFFRVAHTTLSSQKMTGQFPNYAAIFPKYEGPALALDVETISDALNRCLLFSDEGTRAVAFHLSETELRIHSAAQNIGETNENLDIQGGPKEAIALGFNGDYLKDLFGAISGTVELQFKDNHSAILFTWRTDEGMTLQYVVMPMRLGDEK